mmetsp:Transcript_15977/g.65708  ORF Transcript_15977/g.65708 Transcript_15977/m.65708 type:complete len:513 (-) Transcript_15977:1805-3343(-)|eukprot:CAMPEP_0113962402 /NCGR_PEP_ID=MMETSP0011_2-20120614/5894_1 /TAXON_ID=101924 /ORGANISM="Rhodosorus marinus" /LENGTH=512 /DNA_ID=CAMNT_0000974249 /DNA_START=343 /DNA_END=1881 /DNA_ORIENTATION=- /assembly_acc=CAM_ASM_000156
MGDQENHKVIGLREDGWVTLREGEGWQRAEVGDEIVINAIGRRSEEKTELDRRDNLQLILGDSSVPASWNEALQSMARGEIAKVGAAEKELEAAGFDRRAEWYELELLSWIPRRDLMHDGTAIEYLLKDGEGWERPGRISEVHLRMELLSTDPHPREILPSVERTIATESPNVPEMLRRSIDSLKIGSIVRIHCKAARTKELVKLFDSPLEGEVSLKVELLEFSKMEDVFGDESGVRKVLREGLGFEKPGDGSEATCQISYRKKGDDTVLWSGSQTFVTGDGVTSEGIDAAVKRMKRGEKCILYLRKDRAFSDRFSRFAPVGVLSEEDLVAEIELLDFNRPPAVWTLPFDDAISAMKKRKDRGNELFKEGRYDEALGHYDRAETCMTNCQTDLDVQQRTVVDNIRATCLVNMAACYDKLGNIEEMLAHADKAVSLEPQNVKALFRRGTAHMKLGNLQQALNDVRFAADSGAGNDPEVRRRMKEIVAKISKEEREEREKYPPKFRNMFKKKEG